MSLTDLQETIAACASPPGRGAVAMVRISGPRAHELLALLLGGAPTPRPGRLRRAALRDPTSAALLDDALVVRFDGPRTYTGEDLVELHLHGNPVLVDRVLETLFAAGARVARPGEFTLRAWLNGRHDLTQAEAIHDLIAARSPQAAELAAGQLLGTVSKAVGELADRLLELTANLEAGLDFPDDVEDLPPAAVAQRLAELVRDLDALAASHAQGRRIKEGYRVVLAGAPNAGKSSLFNALLGHPRALVTEEAGTTRDYLEEWLPDSRAPILLVDTAGLRPTESVAESAGIERANRQLALADHVLLLVPATRAPDRTDHALLETLAGRAHDLVVTQVDRIPSGPREAGPLHLSVQSGEGLDLLRRHLEKAALEATGLHASGARLTTERQRQAVSRAARTLEDALRHQTVTPQDILASQLREALHQLHDVLGRGPVAEEVLNTIFNSFCIGK